MRYMELKMCGKQILFTEINSVMVQVFFAQKWPQLFYL